MALQHTLCAIQEVQNTHYKITCGIHNPLKKYFPYKCSISNRLGYNTILLVNPNPDFNVKIFWGSYAMVYTGKKTP